MVFFKTIAPVEPVSFVQKICEDALANPTHKRTRTAKRLAPMSLMGKATMEGLESVAREVLKPSFHDEPVTPKKVSCSARVGGCGKDQRMLLVITWRK